MKTSNIIFSSTLALILLLGCVPQLLGFIKVRGDDKPLDFLSQFWHDLSDSESLEGHVGQFHHVKLDGNGRYFFLALDNGDTDSVKVSDVSSRNVQLELQNDTLFIKSLNTQGNAISLHIPNKLHSFTVTNAQTHTIVTPELLDGLQLSVLGQSEFTVTPFRRDDADTIQKFIPTFHVSVSEQSKAFINTYYIGQLNADINEGLLRYSPDLKVDTLNASLRGKSAVSASYADVDNHVRVLNVSGDKEYFRKDLIGKQVQLNVAN